MIDFYQGPGRNIEFCLISSGIDFNPDHGSEARAYYSWLKNVIQSRAELHFENRTFRELHETDISGILLGYNQAEVRTVHQFLFGLVEHSHPWTPETLTAAIDATPFPRSIDPKDGECSIDFAQSKEDGMTLFENMFITGSDIWVEHREFYYSAERPIRRDGESGDVWFVVADGPTVTGVKTVEIWIKPAFTWVKLSDYLDTLSPVGTFTLSETDPGNSTNSWWLDLTGINIRKYSSAINNWEPAKPVTVSPTAPTGLSDGDLWLKITGHKLSLFEFVSATNSFIELGFSGRIVQDRETNTAFVGEPNDNNFTIVCGDEALLGVPFNGGGTQTLRVKKDSVLVQSMVDCINLIGPDLEVTAGGPGEVNIEHLPFTTFPEQVAPPATLADNGTIFTLDIGGNTEFFYKDDSGNVVQITNDGITVQNVFLAISTLSAVPGQTVFSVPPTAKAVLTVKVNGVDTTAWTFASPSVTYDPIGGGYVVQSGDVFTVLYYGS